VAEPDRGLVDEFTLTEVSNMTQVVPRFADMTGGYRSRHNHGAMGIICNAKTVKDPPKDWKAFVEGTIAGQWKASMPSVNYPCGGFTVSIWSMAKTFGGDVDNIEPGLENVTEMQRFGNLQAFERDTPLAADAVAAVDPAVLAEAFHDKSEQVYGHAERDAPLQVISIRLVISGETDKPDLPRQARVDTPAPVFRHAPVWMDGQPREAAVFRRTDLHHLPPPPAGPMAEFTAAAQ
jgi:hypothetical protein